MATRKSGGKARARAKPNVKGGVGSDLAVGTTVSGPSHPAAPLTELADHAVEQQTVVEGMPFNWRNRRSMAHAPLRRPSRGLTYRCLRRALGLAR